MYDEVQFHTSCQFLVTGCKIIIIIIIIFFGNFCQNNKSASTIKILLKTRSNTGIYNQYSSTLYVYGWYIACYTVVHI